MAPTPARKLLAIAMEKRGLNQAELTRELDIGSGTVNNLLAGRRGKRMTLDLALKLQSALGLDPTIWIADKPKARKARKVRSTTKAAA